MAKTKDQMMRELQVEQSLDRVRTAAFEMTAPEDLENVAKELFEAFDALGFGLWRCNINFVDEGTDQARTLAAVDGGIRGGSFRLSEGLAVNPWSAKVVDEIKRGRDAVTEFEGEALRDYYRGVGEALDYSDEKVEEILKSAPDPMITHWLTLSRNLDTIELTLGRYLSEEELAVGRRFADVFDFAYSRYLELKGLADQNRELHVEAALERVRARALGMRKSEELRKVSAQLNSALHELDLPITNSVIAIVDAETNIVRIAIERLGYPLPMVEADLREFTSHMSWADEGWQREGFRVQTREDEEFIAYRDNYTKLLKQADPEYVYDGRDDSRRTEHTIFFSYGAIMLICPEPISDIDLGVVTRFAGVFEFAYSRFIELKRLEDQNRELQVEAALEHIRALGMRSSDDIGEVTAQLHEQFDNLGISTRRVGIWILDAGLGTGEVWATDPAGELLKCEPFTLSVLLENEYTAGW